MMETWIAEMDARQTARSHPAWETPLAPSLQVLLGRVLADNSEIKDPARPLIMQATVVLPPAFGMGSA